MTPSAPVVAIGRPDGSYRRRIRMRLLDPTAVKAALEDDFHRFTVVVQHDSKVVMGISATAGRWPWSTCPAAGAQLEQLVGMELSTRCTAVAAVADPRWQCTHQFDLAGLAVAHAARDDAIDRQYDIEVPPATEAGVQVPRLWRDGTLALKWTIGYGAGLTAPPPFTGAPWRGGFIKWADATLEPDAAEAAIVLRRACEIGMGRGMNLEGYGSAAELAELMTGVCYTMQPEVMPGARREIGSIRDFADHPDALLADDV
ncbi:MAG: DUF2889 domain-containing protein [Acidimicrobiia bacterium]